MYKPSDLISIQTVHFLARWYTVSDMIGRSTDHVIGWFLLHMVPDWLMFDFTCSLIGQRL